MDSDDESRLRAQLAARLLALAARLPTSSVGRLGRTAMAVARAGGLAWRRRHGDQSPADVESLIALVASLGQLKGVAMKTGQLLSYFDTPLAPEIQSALAVLQTHSPAMPFEQVASIVRAELHEHAAPLLARMEANPVAAASIGQVHRAELPGGGRVAVKVQYPEIERAIDADFRSAAIGSRFVGVFAPGADVQAVMKEVHRALLEECDYEREATYQERVGALYTEHPILAVPAVHRSFSSRRVLTTSFVDGVGLESFLATHPPQADRDRLGVALFEFYVGTLLRHGLYNWDPHPGNYLFASGGRLAMLDYGSTREFSRDFVEKLLALTRAVRGDTPAELHQALLGLGMVREGERYDLATARALVRSFYGPMLRDEVNAVQPGEARPLREVMATKRELLKLHVPGEMVFVLRIRFGLMGVLARLGARANWYRLEERLASG